MGSVDGICCHARGGYGLAEWLRIYVFLLQALRGEKRTDPTDDSRRPLTPTKSDTWLYLRCVSTGAGV